MTDQFPTIEVQSLADQDGRRQAFAQFRQSMLGIGDISSISLEAETSYLASGSPLGGFVDGTLQGVVNGFGGAVALPGGNFVSHLSVTHVGVDPLHTRKGIARVLLNEQLRQAHAQGYVVAGLRASDARIYGRYGYGIASWSVRQEVDLANGGRPEPQRRTDLRLVDALESFDLFRSIASAAPALRAATLQRWDGWWKIQEFRTRHGSTPHYAVVVGPQGAERGYIRFHIQAADNWFASTQRTAIIDDLIAHDDDAWRALLGHVLSQDILHTVILPSRPVDDPLPLFVKNPRAVRTSDLRDESWIRPLDLHKLLNARRYDGAASVAIQVNDPLIPDNTGVWTLSADGAIRSNDTPSLTLSIETVAELVFGASTASTLVAASKIVAGRSTIDALNRLFATDLKPHSGISF